MELLALNIYVIGLVAGLGTAVGWLLRSFIEVTTRTASHQEPTSESPDSSPAAVPEVPVEEMAVLMSRVHQLTASVAADVGAHSDRVQKISEELSSGGDVDTMVAMLMKANVHMQSKLQAAEQKMQQQAEEIETHVKTAHTDQLTKLPNRRAFDEELYRCGQAFIAQGQPFCVMMVDVDHFKKFNDTYGHQAGDEVLGSVGEVLRREVLNDAIVCRYGGEEFAVVFPATDLKTVIPLAERARAAIGCEIVEYDGMDLRVTASGGLAQIQPAETCESLVKRADASLYTCKANGRNCGYWHDTRSSWPMVPKSQVKASAAVRTTIAGTSTNPSPEPVADSRYEPPTSERQDDSVFHLNLGDASPGELVDQATSRS